MTDQEAGLLMGLDSGLERTEDHHDCWSIRFDTGGYLIDATFGVDHVNLTCSEEEAGESNDEPGIIVTLTLVTLPLLSRCHHPKHQECSWNIVNSS